MAAKRAKQRKSHERKRRARSPLPTFFIVCEGSKTERRYFERFRKALKGMASINICGGNVCGTGAAQIVEHAIDNNKGRDYVWAVFDRDRKPEQDISRAFRKAEESNVHIAFSNPCFELWYLLHFQDQEAHISCKNVINRLGKEYLPNYDKSMDVSSNLFPHQSQAMGRARSLRQKHQRESRLIISNPSTSVDILVEQLEEIKESGKDGVRKK